MPLHHAPRCCPGEEKYKMIKTILVDGRWTSSQLKRIMPYGTVLGNQVTMKRRLPPISKRWPWVIAVRFSSLGHSSPLLKLLRLSLYKLAI
eukprot:3090395-Amphidinium_carterae.1